MSTQAGGDVFTPTDQFMNRHMGNQGNNWLESNLICIIHCTVATLARRSMNKSYKGTETLRVLYCERSCYEIRCSLTVQTQTLTQIRLNMDMSVNMSSPEVSRAKRQLRERDRAVHVSYSYSINCTYLSTLSISTPPLSLHSSRQIDHHPVKKLYLSLRKRGVVYNYIARLYC